MAAIHLNKISKRFGKTVAVDNFNLQIDDKEFVVLVGPSGCGKSTTLRIIAGLEEQTEGEVYIGDADVSDVPPWDRDIAMVFQNYALYPHMSVFKNLSFGLEIRKVPKHEISKRVNDVAATLGIETLLNRKPKELSGGQRQRVAMGRAIVRQPVAFLFDEPLSNLDAKLRVQMRAELSKLHQRLERTIVYVTHDQIEAMTLATRIVVMQNGKTMQVGTPYEVYNQPENFFVAGFIGSPAMNFMDVKVEEKNGELVVRGSGFELAVPQNLNDRYLPVRNKQAVFGIRPEHIFSKLIRESFPGGEMILLDVEVVEYVGSEMIVFSSCGSDQVTGCIEPDMSMKPQTQMEFIIDMNCMHLFDKQTGKAY